MNHGLLQQTAQRLLLTFALAVGKLITASRLGVCGHAPFFGWLASRFELLRRSFASSEGESEDVEAVAGGGGGRVE